MQDRRTIKTRQAISEAFFMLMQEKPYSRITIQDIIDRANVGRSTFYSHFATKDELLLNSTGQLLDGVINKLISCTESDEEQPKIILLPVKELFEHIKENTRVLKGLMKDSSSEIFFARIQAYWDRRVTDYLNSKLPKDRELKVPVELLTYHISSTLIQLLKWWINNKMPYTPAQMDKYYYELITPSLDNLINARLNVNK